MGQFGLLTFHLTTPGRQVRDTERDTERDRERDRERDTERDTLSRCVTEAGFLVEPKNGDMVR